MPPLPALTFGGDQSSASASGGQINTSFSNGGLSLTEIIVIGVVVIVAIKMLGKL